MNYSRCFSGFCCCIEFKLMSFLLSSSQWENRQSSLDYAFSCVSATDVRRRTMRSENETKATFHVLHPGLLSKLVSGWERNGRIIIILSKSGQFMTKWNNQVHLRSDALQLLIHIPVVLFIVLFCFSSLSTASTVVFKYLSIVAVKRLKRSNLV